MKTGQILGIVLIVLGLYVGYVGVNKLANNTNEVKFLGMEIDASNEKGQTKGIMFIVGAALLIGGGVFVMRKKA